MRLKSYKVNASEKASLHRVARTGVVWSGGPWTKEDFLLLVLAYKTHRKTIRSTFLRNFLGGWGGCAGAGTCRNCHRNSLSYELLSTNSPALASTAAVEGPSVPEEVKAGAQGSARRARGRVLPSSLSSVNSICLPPSRVCPTTQSPQSRGPGAHTLTHTPHRPSCWRLPGRSLRGRTGTMLSLASLNSSHTAARTPTRKVTHTGALSRAVTHGQTRFTRSDTLALPTHGHAHPAPGSHRPRRPQPPTRPPAGLPTRRAGRLTSPRPAPSGPRPGRGLDLAASGGLTKGPRRPGGQPAPAAGAAGSWSPVPVPGRRGACRDCRPQAPAASGFVPSGRLCRAPAAPAFRPRADPAQPSGRRTHGPAAESA